MKLRKEQWLRAAKATALGSSVRIVHGNESRANLVVYNDADCWRAYCQRCKISQKVLKDHVRLGVRTPKRPDMLTLPTDKVPVIDSEYERVVTEFLYEKGMAFEFLPDLYISPRARRLMFQDERGGWHGRCFTGSLNAKWLHYGTTGLVGTPMPCTILTEDLFSMYKLKYAMRGQDCAVCSTLGTGITDKVVLALKNCVKIVCAYDADTAGDAGFTELRRRTKLFVREIVRARPPEGMDPKDMSVQDLIQLMEANNV